MIYDCFIFNSELDLLELRFEFLFPQVDFFVIVEAPRTLSGIPKPLHYKENAHRFRKYSGKIIHLEAPIMENLSDWDYEYFQRNYIKEGLLNCHDDDLILISDVDEIINVREILNLKNIQFPSLIELPLYYYFLNLKTNSTFKVNLIAEYKFIKHLNIGERNAYYPTIVKNYITMKDANTGWHFSYLFGLNVEMYRNKIKAFSHQEYNTPYYTNRNRIRSCIELGVDLFERPFVSLDFVNYQKELGPIFKTIKDLKLDDHFLYEPSLLTYFNSNNLKVFLRFKVIQVSDFCWSKFKRVVKILLLK